MAVDVATRPPSDAAAAQARDSRALTVLFAVTAFLGAALLFLVEPLVAKLLLPSFGGSATVWSTSSLFFQVLLLVAYGYCHLSTARLSRRTQPGLHLALLVLPLLVLPLAVPSDAAPGADLHPALWLLRTLAVLVGLPFAVVATTGPLLQRWYSWSGGHRAEDPYFLFAASNLGSAVGLLAYPLVVESRLTLAQQRGAWSAAYVVFVALTAACGLVVMRRSARGRNTVGGGAVRDVTVPTRGRGPSPRQVAVWGALAFLPSTLMLGVTAHLSTDVAAIPLLWVVPLAIYLGSFVLAFARSSRTVSVPVVRAAAALAVAELLVSIGSLGGQVVVLGITTSLVALAVVSYAAHSRLAVLRPPTEHLTAFYMVIAAGGALGGLLNGLVAPAVFDGVLEYPLALAAVPFLLLGLPRAAWGRSTVVRRDPVRVVSAVLAVLIAGVAARVVASLVDGVTDRVLLVVAVLAGAWLLTRHRVLPLVAVLALCAPALWVGHGSTIESSRTFYGTYRVIEAGGTHTLVHGTTNHGTQFQDPALRRVPTTYYARSGPLGSLFSVLADAPALRVGVVGLGTGTIATYGRPGDDFTFFEIDPEVVRIARDPDMFDYLAESRADVSTVVGDGRLNLQKTEPGSFDVLVLDAFSSDAIPVHLMTRQAVELYASRLRPGGVLMFHITNRVFDLKPVLASAARSLDLRAVVGTSNATGSGATPTQWVALTRDEQFADQLRSRAGWEPLRTDRPVAWTDDYSSVLSVLQ